MSYSVRHTGRPNTLEYRLFLEKDGAPISSWHDIPLYANKEQQIFNMVVEIPRWTNAKYEVGPNIFSDMDLQLFPQNTGIPSHLVLS